MLRTPPQGGVTPQQLAGKQAAIQYVVEMTNKINGKTFVGWAANNSVNTIVDNVMKNVGGSTTSPSTAATSYNLVSGRTYFIKARARVVNAGETTLATKITLSTASGSALAISQEPPVNGTWYDLYNLAVMDANAALRIRHYYTSTADAGNSELQVKYVSVIDVTDILVAYPNLTKELINNTINFLPDDYLDGTQNVPLRGYNGNAVLAEFEGLAQMHPVSKTRPLAGKTIVVFGDSLTQDVEETSGFTYYMEQILGATVINQGYGGTAVEEHIDPNYDAFGPARLLASYLSDTWTVQTTAITNWSESEVPADNERAVSWTTQLAKLQGLDFNDVDIVVFFYGGNSNGATIAGAATADENLASHDGALSYIIQQLQSAYHEVGIAILSCMFKIVEGEDRSLLLLAAEKMVAEYYNIPFYDLYHNMGFNALNFNYTHTPAFSIDNKHPSTTGKQRLGERISAFLHANF